MYKFLNVNEKYENIKVLLAIHEIIAITECKDGGSFIEVEQDKDGDVFGIYVEEDISTLSDKLINLEVYDFIFTTNSIDNNKMIIMLSKVVSMSENVDGRIFIELVKTDKDDPRGIFTLETFDTILEKIDYLNKKRKCL